MRQTIRIATAAAALALGLENLSGVPNFARSQESPAATKALGPFDPKTLDTAAFRKAPAEFQTKWVRTNRLILDVAAKVGEGELLDALRQVKRDGLEPSQKTLTNKLVAAVPGLTTDKLVIAPYDSDTGTIVVSAGGKDFVVTDSAAIKTAFTLDLVGKFLAIKATEDKNGQPGLASATLDTVINVAYSTKAALDFRKNRP